MGGKMKKTLKQIREEWAKRPVEGPDPHELEKKFPGRQFLWAEPGECSVEGCFAPRFKGVPFCKEHHLQAIKEQEVEAEKLAKDKAKKEKSKKWQEEQAMSRVRSTTTVCNNCGIFLRYGERHVVLKEKGKIPKKPQTLEQKYRVLCEHCK
jgi:hypothetical protein